MRVLMVTPWFPNPAGPSSGVFVLRDAQALVGEHEVSVIHLDSLAGAGDRAGDDLVDGVHVRRVPFSRRSVSSWRAVRALVRSAAESADVVHTHALPGILPFAFTRPAAAVPWVHTEHWSGLTSPETLSRYERLVRRVMMRLLRKPDLVVHAAERLARVIRTVRRGPIVYVPCVVVDPRSVLPHPRDPALLRLVGVGGLIPRKGPLVAAEAVAELGRRGVTASLTWVGEGPQRHEVVAAGQRLGLGDRLVLTGTLDDDGVAAALDASDMFILPTEGDNFCIVVAEALTHGRPVVSGASTGAVDYSDPAVSEFVTVQDPAAYADAILRLRDKTASLSAQDVAATVRGRFSPERVAELLTAAYRQAGAPGAQPGGS